MKGLITIIAILVLLIACGTAPASTGPQDGTTGESIQKGTEAAAIPTAPSQIPQTQKPKVAAPSSAGPTNTPFEATTVAPSSAQDASDQSAPAAEPQMQARIDISRLKNEILIRQDRNAFTVSDTYMSNVIAFGMTSTNIHLLVPEGAIPSGEVLLLSTMFPIKSIQLLDDTSTILTLTDARYEHLALGGEYDVRFDVPLIIEFMPTQNSIETLAIDARAQEYVDRGDGAIIKLMQSRNNINQTINKFNPENSPWPVIIGGTDPVRVQQSAPVLMPTQTAQPTPTPRPQTQSLNNVHISASPTDISTDPLAHAGSISTRELREYAETFGITDWGVTSDPRHVDSKNTVNPLYLLIVEPDDTVTQADPLDRDGTKFKITTYDGMNLEFTMDVRAPFVLLRATNEMLGVTDAAHAAIDDGNLPEVIRGAAYSVYNSFVPKKGSLSDVVGQVTSVMPGEGVSDFAVAKDPSLGNARENKNARENEVA